MITKQKGTYDVMGIDAKKRKYVCDVIDAMDRIVSKTKNNKSIQRI